MISSAPLNLTKWIAENREFLKPPVGNRQISEGSDFIISVIGGPNRRTDFHDDPYEEFFYQVTGDINVKIQENGMVQDTRVREGELFLLPRHVPHSPQRPDGTIGLIIERRRDIAEAFEWYCCACNYKLHRTEIFIDSLDHLKYVFDDFYARSELHRCARCGLENEFT